MGDCGICCEVLNKSNRKDITCVFCDFVVCRTCFQKYITETLLDPHCMSCKKTFTYDFITNNCTSVFVTKNLKTHRENVLFDREKAMLPETQPFVVIENQRREYNNQISTIAEQKNALLRQVRQLDVQITGIYNVMNRLNYNNVPEERKKFIRKCPMNDCRGFLSSQWNCGSCEKKICNKCNEEKLEEHECNPDNVASMELINKDTKPCPKCGTMIFRISGCSQIWCTDCHTAWDWNTGRVINGVIHNPHYYEFINRGGTANRNHGDIPCGGLPDITTLRNVLILCSTKNETLLMFTNIHRTINHIQHHELRLHVVEDPVNLNRGLRIRYLMNGIDETTFKTTLQQNEKKRQKTIAFHNIYQMFVNVASDIFRQVVVYIENNYNLNDRKKCVEDNVVILNNLIEYFNENLEKIGKMYKCVYPGINGTYTFVNNILRDRN